MYEREIDYIGFVRSNCFGGMFDAIWTGKIDVAAVASESRRKSGSQQ